MTVPGRNAVVCCWGPCWCWSWVERSSSELDVDWVLDWIVNDEPRQGDKTDGRDKNAVRWGGLRPVCSQGLALQGLPVLACWLRRGGCPDVGVKDHQLSRADDDPTAWRASPLFKRSNSIRSGTCHDAACILSKITSPIWRGA